MELRRSLSQLDGPGTGRVIFVTGDAADGRDTLLRTVAREASSDLDVVAGRLDGGLFKPWQLRADRRAVAAAMFQAVVPLADNLSPAVALLRQIVESVTDGKRAMQALELPESDPSPDTVLTALLRSVASRQPVALIVDVGGSPDDRLWDLLVNGLAVEVTERLPICLVLGLERPAEGASSSPASRAMDVLVARQLGTRLSLPRAELDDVQAWLGPAQSGMAETLLRLSDGQAGVAARLWDEWRETERVARDPVTGWCFTAVGRLDVVGERIARDLAVQVIEAEHSEVRHLLAVAALEGRTFTAEAVGQVVGLDRDGINDRLDALDSIVEERGNVLTSTGEGSVWLYRFRSELDRLVLRGALSRAETERLGGALAEALVGCYGRGNATALATVARLCDAAGTPEVALRYWSLARAAAASDDPVAAAFAFLDRPWERSESDGLDLLFMAASALYTDGSPPDGLALMHGAVSLAKPESPAWATAHYYRAWFRTRTLDSRGARADLEVALRVAKAHGAGLAVADAEHQLANLEMDDGDRASARARYERVLAVRLADGDVQGVATVRQMLGRIEEEEGRHPEALAHYAAAISLARRRNAWHVEVTALVDQARLTTDDAQREALLDRAEARAIEVRSPRGLAEVLYVRTGTGAVETDTDVQAAIARLRRAAELPTGDPVLEARLRERLGTYLAWSGRATEARTSLLSARSIYRDLGAIDDIADVDAQLADLD